MQGTFEYCTTAPHMLEAIGVVVLCMIACGEGRKGGNMGYGGEGISRKVCRQLGIVVGFDHKRGG